MATSTDVILPKGLEPVFPTGCVVCEQTADSTAKITQHAQNPLAVLLLPILFLFGWSRVEFPICRKCKWKFYVQRWGRSVICYTLLGAAVFWLMPLFENWDPTLRKLAVAGACMVIALPYFTFEVFFPRSFDTTAFSSTITYEFRSQMQGIEFYSLNKARYPHSKIDLRLGD